MEKVIAEQNPHWGGTTYNIEMARNVQVELLKLLKLEEMLVLQGVRRCGKTTMFRFLINHLMREIDPREILYINFDAPHFIPVTSDSTFIYTILEKSEQLTGVKIQYLFLDEVHNVEHWENFAKSSYDSQIYKKIFITGSNAKLSHSEYTTLLSGRYIDEFMAPLSFSELLVHHGLDDDLKRIKEKPKVLSIFAEILSNGCFPKVYLEPEPELKTRILRKYFETILLKDCMAAGNIRNTRLLEELSHYLLTNVGTRYSYNNLTEYVSSNEHTVKDYINILKNGFLLDEIQNFSFSLKKQARGKKKSYCIDNGLINAIAFNFFPNEGQLLENLVFTEFKKLGFRDIYLNAEQKECDFIIKNDAECVPIQVCYALTQKNSEREINGLSQGMEVSKAERGYIITFDQEKNVGKNMQAVPFWRFFANSKFFVG